MSYAWSATEAAFEPERDPLQGVDRIGPYRIVGRAGAGGMGVVYRARDEGIGRDVALKLLAGARISDAQRRRFAREMQALGALDHPHLLTVHGTGELHGCPYLVTEWLDGESLGWRLHRQGPLPPREAAEVMAAVARAVAHAHARGILHRDVKPENVVLVPGRGPVLIDFGLAKRLDPGESQLTRSRAFAGTTAYAPPEQLLDASRVDERADVYALGATLFCAIAGEPPGQRLGGLQELLAVAASGGLPRVRDRVPGVPAELDEIVAAALAPHAERTASAAALAEQLGRFLAGGVARPRGSARARAALGVVGALGLVALGAALARWGAPPTPVEPTPSPSPSLATGPSPPASPSAADDALEVALNELVNRASDAWDAEPDAWAAWGAELERLHAARVEAARARGEPCALGDALADAGRYDEALDVLRGAVEAEGGAVTDGARRRATLSWIGAVAARAVARGGDAREALPAARRLAQGLPGGAGDAGDAAVTAMGRMYERLLGLEAPSGAELLARAEEVVGAASWRDASSWLRRQAWVAGAVVCARAPSAEERVKLMRVQAGVERWAQAPNWSHAFCDAWLRGWGTALLPPPRLRCLELMVRHRPSPAAVRELAQLAALRGLLGTVHHLGQLGTGVELRDCERVADQVATQQSAPRISSSVITSPYYSFTLTAERPAVRLLIDLPRGWRLRVRGADVDVDLFVRDDAPPRKDDPRTLRGGTMARDEQVASDPAHPTSGLHQVLIERANRWPEPVTVVLERGVGPDPWVSPWAVLDQFPQLSPELLGANLRARELLLEDRLPEAIALLQRITAASPDRVLIEASVLGEGGAFAELRALAGDPRVRGVAPHVARLLRYEAGRAAAILGDHVGAEALLRGVLAEEERALVAYEELALAQLAQGRRGDALRTVGQILVREREQPAAETLRRLLENLGRPGPAVDAALVRLAEQHPRAQELMARALLAVGRSADVLLLLSQVQPAPPRTEVWRLEAMLRSGRAAEVRQGIERLRAKPVAPVRRRQLEALARRLPPP